jgi:hypothetical protein
MNVQVTERPTDTLTDHDQPMVHLTDPLYTHGLCGAPLLGVPAADLDCVVCAELDKL